MPVSLLHSVVAPAVGAGVVPCGEQHPAQISHYPPVSRTVVYVVVSPPGVGIAG
ncbi:hypothetical protein ACIQYF_07185 [Pseudomonas sp. NPDC096917]|uniref:hypothetical protein n=1 Tax=Pseudomonas sp. NPDC096917 TaxID=3364483 RepID=UPI00383A9409